MRYLVDLGAARTVYVAGDRRVHYEAVAELRKLANRFLRQQVFSYFEDSDERLERIEAEAKKLSGAERDQAVKRLQLLKSWQKNGQRILPLIMAILGGRNGKLSWCSDADNPPYAKWFWSKTSPNDHGRQLAPQRIERFRMEFAAADHGGEYFG